MKTNNVFSSKQERPVTILQFGEGNFLRAFVDWQIDIANEKGVMNDGVAICQPILDKDNQVLKQIELLKSQNNMFHVYLEGVENMKPIKDVRLVKSVMDSFNPYVQSDKYLDYILSPELKLIISNTTEAGIRYEEGDDLNALPPISFPAKVTALLYKRYKHYEGDLSKGLAFVCCELIEDNATTLKEFVLKHAEYNKLDSEFVYWINTACVFCDSLVDRIVSGFPHDTIEQVYEEIGCEDKLVVKGEYFHLWAIGGEGYEKVRDILPLDKAGLNVLFMPSIKKFRDKKVRILNGAHTAMVPIGLQMGCKTVMDVFETPELENYVQTMIAQEVIPCIEGDREELKLFAHKIVERFYNPYIKHQLSSIALNSLSKWEARNFSTVKDNWEMYNTIAKYECFAFAALLILYSGKCSFVPNDVKEHIDFIQNNWDSNDIEATVNKILTQSNIFTTDFTVVPYFVKVVATFIYEIELVGMAQALENLINGRS